MKIFSKDQVFDIEEKTKKTLEVDQSFLMEKAGQAIVNYILRAIEEKIIPLGKFLIISGKGNNGGDGFFCASRLLSLGYSVDVLSLHSIEESSFFNTKYRNDFCILEGKLWTYIDIEKISFSSYEIIIDAILGIGFRLDERVYFYQKVIEKINKSSSFVLSIDTPSGLDVDNGFFYKDIVVRANITLGLGFPKLGYFLDESKDLIGFLQMLSLPIPKEILEKVNTNYFLLSKKRIFKYLPKHSLTAHKYKKGMVIGFGGKKGMKGALSLACLASLYSGSGIVVGVSPKGSRFSFDSLPYEVIKLESSFEKQDDVVIEKFLKKSKSIFLGPGLGHISHFPKFVERVINPCNLPVVFDADALNIYAETPFVLPNKCIFTPHIGEMKRILKAKENISLIELIEQSWFFSRKHNITIVLKGSSNFILSKDKVFISNQGNLILATAGSGDILTGIISSFLSQGLEIEEAACLGVFVHGSLGKKIFDELHSCFFKSGDFLPYIGRVLQELKEENEYK